MKTGKMIVTFFAGQLSRESAGCADEAGICDPRDLSCGTWGRRRGGAFVSRASHECGDTKVRQAGGEFGIESSVVAIAGYLLVGLAAWWCGRNKGEKA